MLEYEIQFIKNQNDEDALIEILKVIEADKTLESNAMQEMKAKFVNQIGLLYRLRVSNEDI